MKEYNPILDDCGIIVCPCHDGEWGMCNIKPNPKCPTEIDMMDGNIRYEFPKYCPAKEGITVKIKGD